MTNIVNLSNRDSDYQMKPEDILPKDHWLKALKRISGRLYRNLQTHGSDPEIDMTSAIKQDLRMLKDYFTEYEKA